MAFLSIGLTCCDKATPPQSVPVKSLYSDYIDIKACYLIVEEHPKMQVLACYAVYNKFLYKDEKDALDMGHILLMEKDSSGNDEFINKRYSRHKAFMSTCGSKLYLGETCELVYDNVPSDLSNHSIVFHGKSFTRTELNNAIGEPIAIAEF